MNDDNNEFEDDLLGMAFINALGDVFGIPSEETDKLIEDHLKDKPMNTHPITLTPDQVRAAMAGRLAQVRMPVKLSDPSQTYAIHDDDGWPCSADEAGDWHRDRCPWGVAGDRLWVREKFSPTKPMGRLCKVASATYVCFPDGSQKFKSGSYYQQPADKPCSGNWPTGWRWSPARWMPSWASRITIELLAVRVERLADMTEVNAIDCGALMLPNRPTYEAEVEFAKLERTSSLRPPPIGDSPLMRYKRAWDAQHSQRYPWASNPWVFVGNVRLVEQGAI